MNNMSTISDKIKRLRKARGYTLEKMSTLLDADLNTTWKIENGRVNITLQRLEKLSKALNISKIFLIDEEEHRPDEYLIFCKFEKLDKQKKEIIKSLIDILSTN